MLVAHLHGNPPQIWVETRLKMAPNQHMPSLQELEQATSSVSLA